MSEEHFTMIEDCEVRESKLSEWEHNFISSLSEHLGGGGSLTTKQENILNRIWDKVTEAG